MPGLPGGEVHGEDGDLQRVVVPAVVRNRNAVLPTSVGGGINPVSCPPKELT
jgi:hypothetical protein